MKYRCAILDDYQNAALSMADWSGVTDEIEVTIFDKPFLNSDKVKSSLGGFEIISAMRERTPFPRDVIAALPNLRLLMTTGMANKSIDVAACRERGVVVSGTRAHGTPTVGIVFGLMLELTRRVGFENARIKAGELWQVTLGSDLEGLTLGIVGLGKLGQKVARVANAFGMKVIAWSPNLTPEGAEAGGATYATKTDLLARSDIITIHMQLSERSTGLLSDDDLRRMKRTAYLINTSRGAIVDERALIAVLTDKQIGGAGLDVFNVEPLPFEHPFRSLENVVISPHLGYVSRQNYEIYFRDVVENIRAFLDGKAVRELT